MRRHPGNPVPDIFSLDERRKIKEKTVYVVRSDGCLSNYDRRLNLFFHINFQKGFNEDLKLDDLQTFFSQYGKVGICIV